jgi:hypothetical protein
MTATIEVNSRKEAAAIRTGLEDPATRAFVIVMGELSKLPSNRARRRVLEFVRDYFDVKIRPITPDDLGRLVADALIEARKRKR